MRIGRSSYSIYCLHYFFVCLAVPPIAQIMVQSGWNHDAIALVAFAVVGIAATLVSSLTYRLIELPFIAKGKTLAIRWSRGAVSVRSLPS